MITRIREWWDERQYGQPYRDMVARRQADVDAGNASFLLAGLMRSEKGRRALYRAELERPAAWRHGRHRRQEEHRDE